MDASASGATATGIDSRVSILLLILLPHSMVGGGAALLLPLALILLSTKFVSGIHRLSLSVRRYFNTPTPTFLHLCV